MASDIDTSTTSDDELHAIGVHDGETGPAADKLEYETGAKLAREGKELPDGSTEQAKAGFESVPAAEHGKPESPQDPAEKPEVVVPLAKEEDGSTKVDTIMGGDIQHNPPAGGSLGSLPTAADERNYEQDKATADSKGEEAPTAVVAHRPLTKKNLPYHATIIAEAVLKLEQELAAIGDAPEDGDEQFEPTTPGLDELSEGAKDARIAEAAMFVGNAVYGRPDTSEFRPNVLWAIAQALRSKLVIRHFASTPDAG